MTFKGLNGIIYHLDAPPIGSGGEGDVYSVQGMDYVVKIYTPGALSLELMEKLKVMIYHPPNESVLSQVAWPLDMVFDDGKQCRGFVMPKLSINAELGEVYKYPSALPISAQQKINIAQNICVVIAEVHSAGYVFGDFNPRNIGLDVNTGLVSFLDTDTYHVVDPIGGATYRCNVCAPGYAAPELLNKCSDYVAANPSSSKSAYAQTPLPTFTKETDNFALAIHIFKLLMNGYTPFGGISETASVSQSSPGVGDAAVRRDSYCFKPGYKHQSVAIPELDALPEEIADLFTRAFIVGKVDPSLRPDAVEWHGALSRFEENLVTCAENQLHQYDEKNNLCPLCEADSRFSSMLAADSQSSSLKQKTYVMSSPQTNSNSAQPSSSQTRVLVHGQNTNKQITQSTQNWKGFGIVAAAVVVIAIIAAIAIPMINRSNTYNEAHSLFKHGRYMEAREMFASVAPHGRSEHMMQQSEYNHAHALLADGYFTEARDIFTRLGSFGDSEAMITETYYQYARHLLFDNGNFEEAREILRQIHPFGDSEELINESYYLQAMQLLNTGNHQEARTLFTNIMGFKSSTEQIQEIDYAEALDLRNSGQLRAAHSAFSNLGSFSDSQAQLREVENLIYSAAVSYYRAGNINNAQRYFGYTSGIGDTDNYMTLIRARNGNLTNNGRNLLDLIEIGFEDVIEVVNNSVIRNDTFLNNFLGRRADWGYTMNWSNAAGHYVRVDNYFHSNIRHPYLHDLSRAYNIRNGNQLVILRNGETETYVWEYTIISLNQIRIRNLYNGNTYTLNRR